MHKAEQQALDPGGLKGARIGIARNFFGFSDHANRIMEDSLAAMKDAGAVKSRRQNLTTSNQLGDPEFEVLLYPVLEARGLTKRYGDVTALDALDLDIAPGEVFCLLGANGAGKTTTINLFLNFVEPTSGTATIDGLDVTLHSLETKGHIAYIPETVTSCIWTTPPSLTAGIW